MEEQGKSDEQGEHELKLSEATTEVKDVYGRSVIGEIARLESRNGNKKSQSVDLETKEHILKLALSGRSVEDIQKALKMSRDYEDNSRGGRPPIGGAIDD
jgi:hypothetical protein